MSSDISKVTTPGAQSTKMKMPCGKLRTARSIHQIVDSTQTGEPGIGHQSSPQDFVRVNSVAGNSDRGNAEDGQTGTLQTFTAFDSVPRRNHRPRNICRNAAFLRRSTSIKRLTGPCPCPMLSCGRTRRMPACASSPVSVIAAKVAKTSSFRIDFLSLVLSIDRKVITGNRRRCDANARKQYRRFAFQSKVSTSLRSKSGRNR